MLIDIHSHIGRILPDRKEFMDVTNLINKMDAWGIDKACVLPVSEHPEGAYLEADTEDVIAACARYPDRLIPFCLIDPRYGNRPDMDFGHLFDEYKARGCKGLGELLPKLDFDDIRCLNLYRQAGKYGMPVLFDMQDGPYGYGLCDSYGLPRLERALRACPDTIFVGHGPTFWAEISSDVPEQKRSGYPDGPVHQGGAVPRLMRQYPNLWADTSAGSGYNALTRDKSFGLAFVDEFQDKLIFGTDSCRRSDVDIIAPVVAWLAELRTNRLLSDDALDKVAFQNARRLLNL
ncbi:MAG: amidohydrolase family protein [Ruminococcaceae bacterium]|jgi:predicted TIM-barrel fold metal-dependent hydrolase|nr:amidohydrolase family protein [Oscillospiraceae bacterium]